MFRSPTRLAAKLARMKNENADRWAKDVRACVKQKVFGSACASGRIIKVCQMTADAHLMECSDAFTQVIVLLGECWTQDMQAKIRQDLPAMEIIHL